MFFGVYGSALFEGKMVAEFVIESMHGKRDAEKQMGLRN